MTRMIRVYNDSGGFWELEVKPDTPVAEARKRAWAAGKGYPHDSSPTDRAPEEGDQAQPEQEASNE